MKFSVTQLKEVKALKKCLIYHEPDQPNLNQTQTNRRTQNVAQNIIQQQQPRVTVENIRQAEQVADIELQVIEPTAIEDESGQQQIVPNVGGTFVSNLGQTEPSLSKSVPLHRDNRATQHVPLDNLDLDIAPFETPEHVYGDLPMLDDQQIARLGFLDGAHGKRMSQILRQRQDNIEIVAEVHNTNQPIHMDSLPPEELAPNLNMPSALEPPSIETFYEQINNRMEELHVEPPQEQLLELQPMIENIQNNIHEREQQRENSPNRDSMAERYNSFRKAIEAAQSMLNKAKKRVRRPQRQNRPPVEEVNRNDSRESFFKLRKELTSKVKRRNRPRPVKLLSRIHIGADFFGDMELFQSNDLPFEDEENVLEDVAEPDVTQNRRSDFERGLDVPGHVRLLTSTPMNVTKRKQPALDSLQASKRQKTDEIREFQEIEMESNLPQNVEALEIPADNNLNSLLDPVMEIPEPPPQVSLPSLLDAPNYQPIVQPSIEIPQPVQQSMEPSIELPAFELPQNISDPLSRISDIQPERRKSKRSLLDNLQMSAANMDYDRLMRTSRLRKTPVDPRSQILPDDIFHHACESISQREAKRVSESRVEVPQLSQQNIVMPIDEPLAPAFPEKRHPAVQRSISVADRLSRITISNENQIEITTGHGLTRTATSYELKCTAIFIKLRNFMCSSRENQRLSLKEVFNHLKNSTEPKFALYQRIVSMVEKKLFIGTYGTNDMLTAIELPLELFEESFGDKENVSS